MPSINRGITWKAFCVDHDKNVVVTIGYFDNKEDAELASWENKSDGAVSDQHLHYSWHVEVVSSSYKDKHAQNP